MKIQIQSIHFKADQKLITYIEQKISKLETFYDGIIDTQVYLKLINNNQALNKEVEIKINVQQQSIFKTQTAQTFEAATDLAVDALKTQLKRYKSKVKAVS